MPYLVTDVFSILALVTIVILVNRSQNANLDSLLLDEDFGKLRHYASDRNNTICFTHQRNNFGNTLDCSLSFL